MILFVSVDLVPALINTGINSYGFVDYNQCRAVLNFNLAPCQYRTCHPDNHYFMQIFPNNEFLLFALHSALEKFDKCRPGLIHFHLLLVISDEKR